MIDPLQDGISKVELLDHMGSDLTVVNAARVSMAKESDWDYSAWGNEYLSERDTKLINYLATNGHWTPFSQPQIQLRIKMPIFVARQWYKHQIGFTRNEVSRRYVSDEPEFYIPKVWRKKADNVKQGSSDETVVLDGTQKCEYCGGAISFVRKEDERMKRFCSAKCREHHYRKNTHQGWASTKWSALKASASKRGIDFLITVEDLIDAGQPAVCKYLDIPINYKADGLQPDSASVNRINPALGYVKGNIEIISNRANSMLLDASPEELLRFTKNVALIHGGIFLNTAQTVEGYYNNIKETYNWMISAGVCAEQARSILPCSHYTEFVETGSLAAYARLCGLRLDSHAQKEIQWYAQAVSDLIKPLYPVSWEALS